MVTTDSVGGESSAAVRLSDWDRLSWQAAVESRHAPLLVCKKAPGGVVSFVRWGVALMASFVCVTIETTRSKHGRSCVLYRQCLTYSPLFGHRDPTLGALCASTFDIHVHSIHLHHVSGPASRYRSRHALSCVPSRIVFPQWPSYGAWAAELLSSSIRLSDSL